MSFAYFRLPAQLSKLVVGSHVTEGWCTLPEWWAARLLESQPMCCACRRKMLQELPGTLGVAFLFCATSHCKGLSSGSQQLSPRWKTNRTLYEQGCLSVNKRFIIFLFLCVCVFLAALQYVEHIPVVPHKAVAKVSEQETYRRGWLLWFTDGRANPLMDWKVVGGVFFGVVAMVAVVTSPTTAGL